MAYIKKETAKKKHCGPAEHGKETHIKSFELQMGWDGNNGSTKYIAPGSRREDVSVTLWLVTVFGVFFHIGELPVKTIFANLNNLPPKRENHRLEALCCHQHVQPGATALGVCWLNVQAFMTESASSHSFLIMWSGSIQMSPENIPKYSFVVPGKSHVCSTNWSVPRLTADGSEH